MEQTKRIGHIGPNERIEQTRYIGQKENTTNGTKRIHRRKKRNLRNKRNTQSRAHRKSRTHKTIGQVIQNEQTQHM